MNIQLNGEMKSLAESTTLSDFIKTILQMETRGVAVAVNQVVISKKNWEEFLIQENDQIEIVRATQGG